MQTIKLLSAALVAAAALAALPASAQSSNESGKYRCVNAKDVVDTISKDGVTMTFRMRDGTTMVNHLITRCDSLKWGGFSWVTAPGGEICGGSQTLRAFVTGEICRLGAFDPPVKISSASR